MWSLQISGDSVVCQHAGAQRWTVPVAAIVVIAEYTTPNGPWDEDWFVEIVSIESEGVFFYHCPVNAGITNVIRTLTGRLGAEGQLTLVNSTDWNSRVVWPADISDVPYYELHDVPPRGFIDRLRKRVLPAYKQLLTETVRDFLRSRTAPPP